MEGQHKQGSTSGHLAASPALEAALGYLARGWAIIPIRPGDKRPLVPWEHFQRRKATEAEVKGWYARWPRAGVGIVLGAVSGGLVVLDIDPRHGGDETLDRPAKKGRKVPNTPTVRTGGDGWHYYFAEATPTIPSLLPGIDLKGEGSYVVAPPSIHPSGKPYAWEPGLGPWEVPLAPLPDWALASIALRATPGASRGAAGNPPPEGERIARPGAWRLLNGPIPDGQRNDSLTRLAGWLRLYHPALVVNALLQVINLARCSPPLDTEEVERISASVCRYPQPGVNGHPRAAVPDWRREGTQ